jgi:hypothetical protein
MAVKPRHGDPSNRAVSAPPLVPATPSAILHSSCLGLAVVPVDQQQSSCHGRPPPLDGTSSPCRTRLTKLMPHSGASPCSGPPRAPRPSHHPSALPSALPSHRPTAAPTELRPPVSHPPAYATSTLVVPRRSPPPRLPAFGHWRHRPCAMTAALPYFRHGLQAQPGMGRSWAVSATRLGRPCWASAGFGPVAGKLFSNSRFCLFNSKNSYRVPKFIEN